MVNGPQSFGRCMSSNFEVFSSLLIIYFCPNPYPTDTISGMVGRLALMVATLVYPVVSTTHSLKINLLFCWH